jgi:hypothetical protein
VVDVKKHVKRVMVSRRGRGVRVVFEDGGKFRIDFDDYVRVFHDSERAKNEYLLQIWYFLSTRTDLGDDRVREIMKTVKERLTEKPRVILPI